MNKYYLFCTVEDEQEIVEFDGSQEEAIREAYRMVDDEEADSVIVTNCLTGADVYYRNRYGEQVLA
jgi:hypothetical protein